MATFGNDGEVVAPPIASSPAMAPLDHDCGQIWINDSDLHEFVQSFFNRD
jgi:hypothetical protein